jgi:RHS repeat-associated protein
MLLTDETASATATLAYSAFGEPVGDPAALPTRYQFAGGHGYESGLLTLPAAPGTAPLTFQHLGARWYQPNTARFIQRDPIGLGGGMNLYSYCVNNPVAVTDPSGLVPPEGTTWPPSTRRGGGFGPRPGDPPKPKDKRPPKPQPAPDPVQEIVRERKKIVTAGQAAATAGLVGGSVTAGSTNPVGAIGVALAILLDELVHPNEPLNPCLLGSMDEWYDWHYGSTRRPDFLQ